MEHKLTLLQAKLLESLKWFDSFCKQNNLRYYAIGGTMLGAMRHQGFIPWDDDIDLGMPRADYEKLRTLSKTLTGRFVIESYDSEAEDFIYPFTKLYDTSTTLVEHSRKDVVRGVYIDIFPIDGIGDSKEESFANYRYFKQLYQLQAVITSAVRKGRSPMKNAAVVICRLIPKFMVNQRRLRIKMNNICLKYDYDQSKFGGNLFGAYWDKEIIDLSLFGIPKYYQFEDMMIAGPEKADAYLTHIYSDWRKLPPLEKRVSHHDFVFLDLNNSYIDK